jgi:hypothetical protein
LDGVLVNRLVSTDDVNAAAGFERDNPEMHIPEVRLRYRFE